MIDLNIMFQTLAWKMNESRQRQPPKAEHIAKEAQEDNIALA